MTMSRENVEVAREAFDAWERGDLTAMLRPLADNVVSRRVTPLPNPDTHRGPEGVLEMFIDWIEAYDDFESWADEFIDAGESVVVRVPQRVRFADGTRTVEETFWFRLVFAGGKIIRLEVYADREQALTAVGPSE
jgi:ketosteroid isomerase-like protein